MISATLSEIETNFVGFSDSLVSVIREDKSPVLIEVTDNGKFIRFFAQPETQSREDILKMLKDLLSKHLKK